MKCVHGRAHHRVSLRRGPLFFSVIILITVIARKVKVTIDAPNLVCMQLGVYSIWESFLEEMVPRLGPSL